MWLSTANWWEVLSFQVCSRRPYCSLISWVLFMSCLAVVTILVLFSCLCVWLGGCLRTRVGMNLRREHVKGFGDERTFLPPQSRAPMRGFSDNHWSYNFQVFRKAVVLIAGDGGINKLTGGEGLAVQLCCRDFTSPHAGLASKQWRWIYRRPQRNALLYWIKVYERLLTN